METANCSKCSAHKLKMIFFGSAGGIREIMVRNHAKLVSLIGPPHTHALNFDSKCFTSQQPMEKQTRVFPLQNQRNTICHFLISIKAKKYNKNPSVFLVATTPPRAATARTP